MWKHYCKIYIDVIINLAKNMLQRFILIFAKILIIMRVHIDHLINYCYNKAHIKYQINQNKKGEKKKKEKKRKRQIKLRLIRKYIVMIIIIIQNKSFIGSISTCYTKIKINNSLHPPRLMDLNNNMIIPLNQTQT